MIENKVKRGDVVALAYVRSVARMHGPTERRTVYTLCRVNGANAAGEATSLLEAGGTVLEKRRKDYRLENVRTISDARQQQAQRAFAALTWDSREFASIEDLKAAILTA